MKIGLLECDDVADALINDHGNYADMIETMLRSVDPTLKIQRWACHKGELPDATDAADAWITTGSKASATDDEPWIHALAGFIRQLQQAQRPLVGICFGHQLIAQALGGQVEKSPKGWGVGAYTTRVQQQQPWMQPTPNQQLNLLASHQDQVTALPEGGLLLARNAFCPHYMMQVGNRILGIQGHPEFTKAYSAALMNLRHDRIGAETVEAAMHSLDQPLDAAMVGQWIINFMRHPQPSADSSM